LSGIRIRKGRPRAALFRYFKASQKRLNTCQWWLGLGQEAEQPQNDDHGNRNADQPKQATTKHEILPRLLIEKQRCAPHFGSINRGGGGTGMPERFSEGSMGQSLQ